MDFAAQEQADVGGRLGVAARIFLPAIPKLPGKPCRMPHCRSVPPSVSVTLMGVRRRAPVVFGWRLPVEQGAFDIHAQLAHFFESPGRDEVLTMAVGLVLYDPLQLFRGIDKDTSNRKRIHGSQTVRVFGLGFHGAPLVEDGKDSCVV